MLNPSAERELTENYRLSTEKARQWWNNQAFESRKNIVIESDAVINDDQEVEDQIVADVADSDYDELPDETKQEIDSQIDEEEVIEEVFEVQGEEYLQCSKCDDLFTSNEDYDIHKSVDHGEEPEDFEDSEETYQLTMNPDLTRESLREANSLLTETEERELYSGYDKNGEIQSSVMPYNVPAKATGKYNDNPNEFFYSNKIFRAGDSALRTSSLGEVKASETMGDEARIWWSSLSNSEKDSIMDNTFGDNSFLEENGYDYYDNQYDINDAFASLNVFKQVKSGSWDELEANHITDTFFRESKTNETYYPDIDLDDTRDERMQHIMTPNDPVTKEEAELLLYGTTDGSKGKTWTGDVSYDEEGNIVESKASEGQWADQADYERSQWINAKDSALMGDFEPFINLVKQFGGDWEYATKANKEEILQQIEGELENLRVSMVDRRNWDYLGMYQESKTNEDDYEERAEWNWLTNKDSAPEVDYGQVDYEDDGVSDISVPNAEPKGEDKNEFLDDVDIKLDEVNFVYPTKSNESIKSYIKESEPFEEEYEEFEDSDEEIIKETIAVRKLTGYSDNSIAQELHINYGVSHEEALEKVYSVEVSTNDKVAQTFFGKMYKECTESEKDELRMYSGSD